MSASSVSYSSNKSVLGQMSINNGVIGNIVDGVGSSTLLTPILESGIYSIAVQIEINSGADALFEYFQTTISAGINQGITDPMYNVDLVAGVVFINYTNFITQTFSGNANAIQIGWNYNTSNPAFLASITWKTQIVKIV